MDIGVHQDGLVHISELSDSFVKNPGDVVKVHQKIIVTVLDLDLQRKRISLSMKSKQAKSDTTIKKEEKKTVPKVGIEREKDKNKTERFANNPFYDALRKK